MNQTAPTEIAAIAGGCFWSIEAVFREVNSVKNVVTGYTEGTTVNPLRTGLRRSLIYRSRDEQQTAQATGDAIAAIRFVRDIFSGDWGVTAEL